MESNTQPSNPRNPRSLSEPYGERYFVARTARGLCAVNYPPEGGSYVGGPFMSWDAAYTYIRVYQENRRTAWIQRGMWAFSAAAVVALGLLGWAWFG